MAWLPMVVLPNIDVRCQVEGQLATIAPVDDERIAELCKEQPRLGVFLGRFTDTFGRPIRPSIMLMRDDAPETYRNGHAVAGFRDLLAMATLPYTRAFAMLSTHTSLEALYSNSFDFHPWMLDKHYKWLIAHTPSQLALDELNDFRGQSGPDLPHKTLDRLDEPVLAALIMRWESRYATTDPTWADRSLFRSLNMATHAGRMPFTTAGTSYDTGRLVALWISAFEILVHPEISDSNRGMVLRMLERIPPANPLPAYKTTHRCPTLNEWALNHMYDARNDYLHGNPVEDDRLRMPNTSYDISVYASLLYRLLLAEFLGLQQDCEIIPRNTPNYADLQGKALAKWMEVKGYQERVEEALYTMTGHRVHRRSLRNLYNS